MERYNFMFPKKGDREIFNRKTIAGFIYEPKFDGTRVMIYKDEDNLEILNSKGEDIIRKYPEFLDIANDIKAKKCILDGIIVIFDKDGKQSNALLQKREIAETRKLIDYYRKRYPATLFVFDILFKDGYSFASFPLEKRKEELRKVIAESLFLTNCPFSSNGHNVFNEAEKSGVNGVIAKDFGSPYEQRRSWAWLKILKENTNNAIVIGYTKDKDNKKKYFEALILANYINGKLFYTGRISEGFPKDSTKEIMKVIRSLKIARCIELENLGNTDTNQNNIVWLKPEAIVKIKFKEIKDKEYIEPSFIRLRFDKKPEECIIEEL